MLIRISPDGKEVLHLYNDALCGTTSKHSDMEINRASDVFYDNASKRWKIKMLVRGYMYGVCLLQNFATRQEAIDYEIKFLEELMRSHKV